MREKVEKEQLKAVKEEEEEDPDGWLQAFDSDGDLYCCTVALGAKCSPLPSASGTRKRKRRRKRRLPRTSSLRGARLLMFTARHRHARQAPAASKFSRPLRQLCRRLPSLCA